MLLGLKPFPTILYPKLMLTNKSFDNINSDEQMRKNISPHKIWLIYHQVINHWFHPLRNLF